MTQAMTQVVIVAAKATIMAAREMGIPANIT